jgi:hypothetical protein
LDPQSALSGSEVSSNPKKKKTYSNISNDTLKKIKNLKPNIMAAATIVKKNKFLKDLIRKEKL